MVKFVSRQCNPKHSDSAAGRLVWVQQKNGSWWPGQIMDASESRLGEAKPNGVSIKLLGRDDVNVEWYNLEVAKQVKAFRCGDLNSCIEKVKALQANSSKRKVKLSQRDNAIILALELESSFMRKDRVDNLFESGNMVKRKRTSNHTEQDCNEGNKKRMRGLAEIDLGSNGLVTKSVPQSPSSLDDLCSFNPLPTESCMVYYKKKKRSKVVFEELMKQEDSIGLLTNLMLSDNLVSVPIIYDELPSPRKASDSDENDSDQNICYNADRSKLTKYELSSMPELLGYDSSDNLFDVLLINEEELSDGFPSHATRSPAEPQNSTFTVPSCQNNPENNFPVWQSKGKRTPRREILRLENQLHRYEILKPLIELYTSPIVYYDVQIVVDESRCSKNVPTISLVSILNRKPVSGQSISVEVLEDGGCELTETRMCSMKTRTSACIPIEVVFSRIHEALNE